MINRTKSVVCVFLATVFAGAGGVSSAGEQVPDLGQFGFGGDSVVLDLLATTGQPMILVDLGDGEPRKFIVDTGASVNVIDSAVAASLGYAVVGEMEIGAPGGPQVPAGIVNVPLARTGNATIKDAGFVTLDVVGFSGGLLQGVIGMGLFRDYLLTFDQGNGRILVSRDSLSADDAATISYHDVGGHMQIDMDVAGITLATHIDTGSMAAFTLPAEVRESLTLRQDGQSSRTARVVGGDRDVQIAQLDGDIRFAGKTYANPNVGFMDPSPGFGNVGSQVLADFVMSIDQRQHLVRFEEASVIPVAAASGEPRRLGVQFRGFPGGSVLTIGNIDPGSLGEQSGLMPGDVLTKLNGKPTEEYDMSSLGALIRGTEPLRFEVDRNGEMQTIEIQ